VHTMRSLAPSRVVITARVALLSPPKTCVHPPLFGHATSTTVLQFQGERRLVADALPLPSYTARLVDPGSDDSRARGGRAWVGEARVPHRYLPPPIRGGFGAAFRRFNAYGISGQGQGRRYAALFPAQGLEAPDFHRLRFFERLGDGALGG
jgi:hypothetical protein